MFSHIQASQIDQSETRDRLGKQYVYCSHFDNIPIRIRFFVFEDVFAQLWLNVWLLGVADLEVVCLDLRIMKRFHLTGTQSCFNVHIRMVKMLNGRCFDVTLLCLLDLGANKQGVETPVEKSQNRGGHN